LDQSKIGWGLGIGDRGLDGWAINWAKQTQLGAPGLCGSIVLIAGSRLVAGRIFMTLSHTLDSNVPGGWLK
jgi:hypothetical protein